MPNIPQSHIPKADKLIDLKGFLCPLPALKTRKELSRMASGKILAVETTDAKTKYDIPDLCATIGADYLECITIDTIFIHIIRR